MRTQVTMVTEGGNRAGPAGRALKIVSDGIHQAGGLTHPLPLSQFTIRHCRHCRDHDGLCLSAGRCAIQDDLGQVLERLREADVTVFATRVAIPDFGQKLRALLDRLQRIARHPAGRAITEGQRAVAVCVGGGAPSCASKLAGALTACGYHVLETVAFTKDELYTQRGLLLDLGRRLAAQEPSGARPADYPPAPRAATPAQARTEASEA